VGHVTPKEHNAPGASDWQTPSYILDLVRLVFPIGFDPASAPENPTGARLFWSPTTPERVGAGVHAGLCGLSDPWPEDLPGFVNPPWGAHLGKPGKVDPGKIVKREGRVLGRGVGWAEKIARHRGELISLVPTRTDSSWFDRIHEAQHLRLDWRSATLRSRIQFIDPETGKVRGGNNSAVTFFYRGPRWRLFAAVFGAHGRLLPGGEARSDMVSELFGSGQTRNV